MARYFKIIEICEDTFENETGEEIGSLAQIVCPGEYAVFVAVDDNENELNIFMDAFDDDEEG